MALQLSNGDGRDTFAGPGTGTRLLLRSPPGRAGGDLPAAAAEEHAAGGLLPCRAHRATEAKKAKGHLGHPGTTKDTLSGHQVDIPPILSSLQDDQAARGLCG